MYKNTIAIFFSLVLLALISLPSIIVVIDDSVDISMFFSVSEEEESYKIKIKTPEDLNDNNSFLGYKTSEAIVYYFKNYPKPHLNLISPPPEANIL